MGKSSKFYRDFSPWNNYAIEEFIKFDDIELHVISPHKGMIKRTEVFINKGIYYHFFKPEPLFPLNFFEKKINIKQYTEFPRNRKRIKKFINDIKPDIINLIGAENPYYSISGLDFDEIPVFLFCQTVYSNPNRKLFENGINHLNYEIEQKLLKKIQYIGCSGLMHYNLVHQITPHAYIFKMKFPSRNIEIPHGIPIKYDFAFWGRITKSKGVENAIEALSIVIKKYPKANLIIAGGGDSNYIAFLKEKIKKLNISENITFAGLIPQYEKLLKTVKQAKFAILPIKLDIISSTIKEAMKMGMPIVTHRTSGTPLLNKDRESVLLSDIDDIQNLAKNMIRLMDSSEFAEQLKANALKTVNEDSDNYTITRKWIEDYKAIIKHFHNNNYVIPEELLFNPNNSL